MLNWVSQRKYHLWSLTKTVEILTFWLSVKWPDSFEGNIAS